MNYRGLLVIAAVILSFCAITYSSPTWVQVRDAQDNPPGVDLTAILL